MNDRLDSGVANALGLRKDDAQLVRDLVRVWREKHARNVLRERYYEMHHKPRDLGISVPPNLRKLEQVIGWPAKAVKALADRSRFDGFTCEDESRGDALSAICERNHLKRLYRQAVREELKLCCSFLAVTADTSGGFPKAIVSAYPAHAASAIYDDAAKRIKAGLVVVATDRTPARKGEPVWVDVYTDEYVISIKRPSGGPWNASYIPHSMGRCLMEPMAYDATLGRPFGRSRISRAVMNLTDNAMRASLRGEVSAEFFTSPQKYLLGVDPEDFSISKWDAYIGSLFTAKGGDDDSPIQFGQLAQGTMQPHTEYMRDLAARFSSETSVPISSLGVIHDNPSSAEAIYAAKEDLVIEAQDLNADNGDALKNVALMALAVEEGTSFEEQLEGAGLIQPKFKNPAMPSLVSQSDAIVKLMAAFPWLAYSDVALEESGFSDDQVQRLRPDRIRYQGNAAMAAIANSAGMSTMAGEVDDI